MIEPYYQKDGITIYNADNVVTLRDMVSDTVDLVVTSPPYDSVRDYGVSFGWDFESLAKELFNVLKPGGVIVWIVNDQTIGGSETGSSFKQALFFMECGLNLHDTMIYQKHSFRFPDKVRYYQIFEYMFVLSKGKPKTINLIADHKNLTHGDRLAVYRERKKSGEIIDSAYRLKNPSQTVAEFRVRNNVWIYDVGANCSTKDRVAYKHPAVFPEKLARDHIVSWSNEGDVVLDPFSGSGTTMKMCRELNRKGVGIEIEKEYCDISVDRLAQGVLF